MNSLLGMNSRFQNNPEIPYQPGWKCGWKKTSSSESLSLDGDPPLEFTASASNVISGFSAKHDSGNIRVWGNYGGPSTSWVVLGGPIIGFFFKTPVENMSIIVGDRCKPKYFGARKLAVRLGETRQL